jgi:hypothetical protein
VFQGAELPRLACRRWRPQRREQRRSVKCGPREHLWDGFRRPARVSATSFAVGCAAASSGLSPHGVRPALLLANLPQLGEALEQGRSCLRRTASAFDGCRSAPHKSAYCSPYATQHVRRSVKFILRARLWVVGLIQTRPVPDQPRVCRHQAPEAALL